MKIEKQGNTVKLWLNAEDTYQWARRPGGAWPCSFLAGRTLFAEFDDGDLVDLEISDKCSWQECPADEFNAITSDFINLGELTCG